MVKNLTQQEFIRKSVKKHGTRYDYSNTTYIHSKSKISIICPIHGTFKQTPAAHMQGRGCQECGKEGRKSARVNRTKTTSQFIQEAVAIHKCKYDYTTTVYKNAKTNLVVVCPTHGSFSVRPNNHLLGKQGCKMCNPVGGYSDRQWENLGKKSQYFIAYSVYIIEVWDSAEKFIKIGKTFVGVSKRCQQLPYEWKVIKAVEGSAKYISRLERVLQKRYKAYKYTPIRKFSGDTECFKQ